MKMLLLVVAASALATLSGCGGSSSTTEEPSATDDAELASDRCRAPALNAAETEYGNDPVRTRTKVVTKGKKYLVTVGIGNPEDGAHDYFVVFAGDCTKSAPTVTEVPRP